MRDRANVSMLKDRGEGLKVTTIRGGKVYKAWKYGAFCVKLHYKGNTLTGIAQRFVTHDEFNSKYYLLTEPGTDTGDK